MRWTSGGVSRDIEDRRGEGGGGFRRAHVGVGGAIGLLVLPQDIPIGVEYFRVLIGVSIEINPAS
jgi:hypothetical protein